MTTATMSTDTARPEIARPDIARRSMIDSQLRPSGVNEPWVLAEMLRVPREDYVPTAARASAYMDRAVPLGDGLFLAPPLVQGRVLAEGAPTSADNVLVISACGYLAELAKPLAGSVVSITPGAAIPTGPFSLILIDGAAEELPAALTDAMAEGGRIVTGIVTKGITRRALGRKTAGAVALHPLADIAIPPLAAYAAPKRWSF